MDWKTIGKVKTERDRHGPVGEACFSRNQFLEEEKRRLSHLNAFSPGHAPTWCALATPHAFYSCCVKFEWGNATKAEECRRAAMAR